MNANVFGAAFLVFIPSILLSYSRITFSHGANPGSETDKLALLAFKSQVTYDPFGELSTWNDSLGFCQWHGITCSLRHRRVTALNLPDQNLTGTISSYIGNLTFLRIINLQNNHFYGDIPHEMGRLFRLRAMVFNRNMFQGEIPINLTRCSELRTLDLVMNKLEGTIPAELGTLFKLTGLGLAVNNLTGSIPQSLSNLLFLEKLSLSENSLSGDIPVGLGQLKRLNMFQISVNNFLTGSIPSQLFNISSMEYFAVTGNQLVGEIPPYIGLTLPNIRVLLFAGNRFTGAIPHTISNASKLEQLDFSNNHFTGSIPVNLGRLKNLTLLNFARNNLGTEEGDDLSFLSSLVNCTHLKVLSLSKNSLHGKLPDSIANFSSELTYLLMGQNQISGSIPTGIEKLKSLISIGMEENLLTGIIPITVGYLSKLQILSIFGNSFSGEIPSSLGNLTYLSELSLDNNSIQGSIPSSLGNCQLLQNLGLSGNNLSGAIPFQVIGLPSLSGWLDLSRNHLTGPIPLEVGSLKNIRMLDLSENKLSGQIPSSLANCLSLASLNLRENSFQGHIPPISSLKGLEDLDISQKNITGKIPNFLDTFLFLQTLNLSFNNLEGEVPKEGIFKNASAVSIIGNGQLCGGIPELHLHSCPSIGYRKLWQRLAFKITASLAICLLSICFVVIVCWRRKGRKALVDSPMEGKYLKISYAELLKATERFSSANLIGSGGYGFVYKGSLGREETPVAVKVLDLQQRGASKSFTAECDALRCIRHRNLVKIITSCSSLDNKGNEFKALVYEFMPNGSLEEWLHQNNELENPRPNLNLMQRLSIAIDVANALEYLHHHCHTRIVHCDLKPSNVLLDNDMVAHVGDFGLARLLYDNPPQDPTSSSRLKGSIGYVSPEYGLSGEVSTYGDVYSFGILLLEMFTGRRPTDDMFKEGLSLHSFVKMSAPDQVADIVDSTILEEALQVEDRRGILQPTLQGKIHETLVSLLRLGLQCSAELPSERKQIKDVAVELQEIQKLLLAFRL
ncbi:putative receptor-like protein kinase At3g47110 [Pistacia vera]|uniref:putative receptor-like protein kinase At3g47110 n=1 Tax=Pistacia vera TaxID=55513 RepID=UPI0012639BEB|nr:putative receptor-like protein kinase At3g47110 [Pistacia vera]